MVTARKPVAKKVVNPAAKSPASKGRTSTAKPTSKEKPRVTSGKKAVAVKSSLLGTLLVDRVARAVDRELAQIENIIAGLNGRSKPTEAERRARTLASLARTLSEVRRMRAGEQEGSADDNNRPRDLDELRERISRRMARVVEGGEASTGDSVSESERDGAD